MVWEITLRCDLACTHCGSRAGKARPDEISTAEALDLVESHRLGFATDDAKGLANPLLVGSG